MNVQTDEPATDQTGRKDLKTNLDPRSRSRSRSALFPDISRRFQDMNFQVCKTQTLRLL